MNTDVGDLGTPIRDLIEQMEAFHEISGEPGHYNPGPTEEEVEAREIGMWLGEDEEGNDVITLF